jgi:ribonuclease HII
MRRLDALYPAYGFAQHVGYITPGHSAVVRAIGPSAVHRLSFQALCYEPQEAPPDAIGVRELSGRASPALPAALPASA